MYFFLQISIVKVKELERSRAGVCLRMYYESPHERVSCVQSATGSLREGAIVLQIKLTDLIDLFHLH